MMVVRGKGPGNKVAVTFENVCRVTYETSRLNQKNVQVQFVYHCCSFFIFDQTTMAQEQKYLHHKAYLCKDNDDKQIKTTISISDSNRCIVNFTLK